MQQVLETQPDFTPAVIDAVCLITVERRNLNHHAAVIGRVLMTLARLDIPVLLMSQSSHQGNFCVVIPQDEVDRALNALVTELSPGREQHNAVRLLVKTDVAILKASTAFCNHLAARGVNILAIAQGAAGYGVSLVVDAASVPHVRVM